MSLGARRELELAVESRRDLDTTEELSSSEPSSLQSEPGICVLNWRAEMTPGSVSSMFDVYCIWFEANNRNF